MLHIEENNYSQTIYQISPRFEEKAGIYIDLIGTFQSRGGFSFQQVAQADAVHAVYDGNGEITHNGLTFPVGPGDIFMLRKGSYYEYRDCPSNPWNYVYFHLNGTQAGAILDAIGLAPEQPVIHLEEQREFWAHLNHLKQEFETEQITGYSAITAAWHMIEQLESGPAEEPDDPAEIAKRLIDQSPTCITSVDSLAQHLNTNRTTLFRRFKQAYGLSVKQYIEDVRFGRIEELVRNTSLPIGQIAEIGGFSDPLYFSRTFRKRYGVSPTQMRSNLKL